MSSDVDARHRAKLEARASGTVPVVTTAPVPLRTTVIDGSVDGLYRRKLQLRDLAAVRKAAEDSKPAEEEPKADSDSEPANEKPKKR